MNGRNIYHARLMFARPFIDSVDFSRHGKELSLEVPFSVMTRLAEVLLDSEGLLSCRVWGAQVESLHFLHLELRGQLRLQCQRCMGDLEYPLILSAELQLLSPEDFQTLGDDDEADCIEASNCLDVLALIEDEILLSLPFAPKHAESECGVANRDEWRTAHPFAVLASLSKVDK